MSQPCGCQRMLISLRAGSLRLSRTKEGILIQGDLQVGIEDECYRCLEPVQRDVEISVEELYTYPNTKASEFSIGDDAI